MAVYNRAFFDLNGKRGYCVDGLPADMIVDLKISVPNRTQNIRLASLFMRDEIVRLVFITAEGSTSVPVALFSSDERSMIRVGISYPLPPLAEGYGGLIVFGEGIRTDIDVATALPISEECLTRFEPSAIPYVSLTCDSVKLSGEVTLSSGDPVRLVSEGVDAPEELFDSARALRLSLIDTGSGDPENPMVAMANGINAYFGEEGRRSPVYKLFGAMPDSSGRITIRFDDHFHFAPVGDPDTAASTLAIGTDLTTEDVCREINGIEEENEEDTEPVCPPSSIEFKKIEYQ